MKIKVRNIFWVLLAYTIFYCYDPNLFPDYITDINILILLATLFIVFLKYKIKQRDIIWIGLFVIYIIYIVLHTLCSSLVESNLVVFKFYVFYPSLIFIGIVLSNYYFYDVFKEQSLIWKLMWAWGLVLFVLGVYEVVSRQYILNVSASDLETYTRSFSGGSTLGLIRARVFSGGYLIIGDLFGILAITAFYLYLRFKKKIYLISVFAFLIGTFLGFARGSIVGVAAGFVVILLLEKGKNSRKISLKKFINIIKWIILFIVLILIVLSISKSNEIVAYWTDRITTIFDWESNRSNVGRLDHWMAFINIWLSSTKNFFFGTGGLTASLLTTYSVTESGFIEYLVEIGLIGTILHYTLILFPFVKYLRSKIKTTFGNWAIACFAILFVHDFVLQVSFTNTICILMWLLALLMTVENRRIQVLGEEILIFEGREISKNNTVTKVVKNVGNKKLS